MGYPDYVKQYRPKGTVIKKSANGTYYAYYATSKRVPEKKYPVQVVKGLAGKIDQYGFHPMTRAVVDTERVLVRECGFTNFLLNFEDEYISRRSETVAVRRNIFRSMIVYLSPESYLCDEADQVIYSTEEMTRRFHVGIPNQITAISKLCEYDLKELEPLKYICNIRMGNRVFQSELTQPQRELLEKLGVTEDEIRR